MIMTFRGVLAASVVTVLSIVHFVSSQADENAEIGDVRLSDGTLFKGRVEIYDGERWGNVCDDYWSQPEGDVVCRQLGFLGAVRTLRGSEVGRAFGHGDLSILLDDLMCVGREQNLLQCRSAGLGQHNCHIDESAGVECIATSAVRLMLGGNYNQRKGFVELSVNGEWGKVCDDGWDIDSARVVCRELGRELVDWNPTIHEHLFRVQFILDDIDCNGDESHLLHCQRRRRLWSHNCGDQEVSRVECSGP